MIIVYWRISISRQESFLLALLLRYLDFEGVLTDEVV